MCSASHRCTDDDPNTFCSTRREQGGWIALRFAADASVGYVSILNRNDGSGGSGGAWGGALTQAYQQLLFPFEVFIGVADRSGDVGGATRCAKVRSPVGQLQRTGVIDTPPPSELGPFMLWCGGALDHAPDETSARGEGKGEGR